VISNQTPQDFKDEIFQLLEAGVSRASGCLAILPSAVAIPPACCATEDLEAICGILWQDGRE